ncbi:MAG: PTS sugar transporter subunit IIA, partial [Longicatena sp.]
MENINMIRDMLKKENVQIVQNVVDWKDAIRTSVQPLVEGHYVEERYIDGVIENTNIYGPYYVLAQDLALIHARSDQGVIEKQLAVTVLKEPIKFSEDGYSVRLLVVLAAADGESH